MAGKIMMRPEVLLLMKPCHALPEECPPGAPCTCKYTLENLRENWLDILKEEMPDDIEVLSLISRLREIGRHGDANWLNSRVYKVVGSTILDIRAPCGIRITDVDFGFWEYLKTE